MNTQTYTQNLHDFLDLANHYPSPHNGQPIRLKQIDENIFDVFFQRERGLQATDISFIFSFVSMGVFMEHLVLAATALGHELEYELSLPPETDLRGVGPVKFATVHVSWNTAKEDASLRQSLLFRQTSRKNYTEAIPEDVAAKLRVMAKDAGMVLEELDNAAAKQAIWLNQRAVFDDMFDEPVRKELDHWLRYNRQEKEAKRDGLAYDCMQLNGPVMKYIVHHPGVLRAPGISKLLRQYYLRTMADTSSVFYVLAPFKTEHDSFNVGMVIMRTWQAIAQAGYYLHPFGTIMSNHAAHQDFLELAGVQDESREKSYLVFIFRGGKSELPVPSLRLPYQEHLIME